MSKSHSYEVRVTWTGNRGRGTADYRAYSRNHVIAAGGKPDIAGSSDPAFRGDAERWNPEDLLVASVSACHKLWYLHLCSENGIVVLAYEDDARGVMVEVPETGGHFTEIVLAPRVTIRAGDDTGRARDLHREAHKRCFIANSLNFPVRQEPTIDVAPAGAIK